MKSFDELQSGLGAVLEMNRPGMPPVEHVLVVLPSFSMGESLLSHYSARIPALEHRYLVVHSLLHRIPGCRLVFVGSQHPGQEVLDYYTSLVPAAAHADVRSRFREVVVPDQSPRPVAEKLLDLPDAMAAVRDLIGGRPAFIEPWNVTGHEVEVATALQVPVNGTSPALRPLGYKSAGRRLFRAAGVPLPVGREDVRTVEDVVDAVTAVRAARPACRAVVVKHDDSGAGDGNVVVALRDAGGRDLGIDEVRDAVLSLPDWYLRDLLLGGVVEELISGTEFASPSAQLDIRPGGEVVLLATHEQELGGPGNQVYLGCRFPAEPAYAPELGRQALAAGAALAALGALGRLSVDFAAARDAGGRWSVFALEVNLRKGGTTHPYAALRHLAPGRYDGGSGVWVTRDGTSRAYRSTDNLVDPTWLGLPPAAVIAALAERGLQLDPRTGTGVVLHMLSCLAVDGRFGLTAIGRDAAHAAELYEATRAAVSGIRGRWSGAGADLVASTEPTRMSANPTAVATVNDSSRTITPSSSATAGLR